MTLTQITNAIAKQIQGVVEEHMLAEDYKVIVCPERIFVDDYLPLETQYITKLSELPEEQYDNPNEPPYKNTIFVVIKMGSGERNMAVANSTVTIQVLSEENDFLAAREIMDTFIGLYNFKYKDGFIQSYFQPEVLASQEQVYAGFRALMNSRGFIRVPEPGIMFVQDVVVMVGPNEDWIQIPYVNMNYQFSAQPDPVAFSGQHGETASLNRQSTRMVSFETYLTENSGDYFMDKFSKDVIYAQWKMNRKFHIVVRTSAEDEMATEILGERRFAIVDEWFVLTGAIYNQELGGISTWGLTFSRALKEEK